MKISEEKAAQIIAYLEADVDRANELFTLTAEEVASRLCADGCSVTVEEIAEFGNQVQTVATSYDAGELDADALDNVAGGALPSAVVGWAISAFGAGYKIGADLANKYGW